MWLKNKIYITISRTFKHPFFYPKILKLVVHLTQLLGIDTFNNIEIKYGHAKSSRLWQSINADNEPVPWMTYPIIDYLNQLNFTDKCIFEYGSGYSSLYWQKRAKKVVSVESNLEWFNRIKVMESPNHKIIFEPNTEGYVQTIEKEKILFDVIVIDGIEREACAENVVKYITPNGMIILDNSERHPQICASLRDQDLIQIDFNGLGPINQYTWTSSIFLKRQFDFQYLQIDESTKNAL